MTDNQDSDGVWVVTGARGQLGLTLQSLWQTGPLPGRFDLVCTDHQSLDITDRQRLDAVLGNLNVIGIVNAAAYTAVDGAESDDETAYRVNQLGAANLADWAEVNKCSLIQISTDFVFDGTKRSPYLPEDEPAPLGVYGASKLAGERAVLTTAKESGMILRTSWLYSVFGKNFVKTMLRLMSERDELRVVNDQVGAATSCRSLSQLLFAIMDRGVQPGIFHWNDGGEISWHEFALAIQQEAVALGLLATSIPIHGIATEQYPTPARRPAYSVLDTGKTRASYDCPVQDWRQQLREVLLNLAKGQGRLL